MDNHILSHFPSLIEHWDEFYVNDQAAAAIIYRGRGYYEKCLNIWEEICPRVQAIHEDRHIKTG